MKKSELKQLIREEYKNVLNEYNPSTPENGELHQLGKEITKFAFQMERVVVKRGSGK